MCSEFFIVIVSLLATWARIAALIVYAAQESAPKGSVVCDVLHVNLMLVGLLQLFLAHSVSDNVPFKIVRSRECSPISRACRIRAALCSIVPRTEGRDNKSLKFNSPHF